MPLQRRARRRRVLSGERSVRRGYLGFESHAARLAVRGLLLLLLILVSLPAGRDGERSELTQLFYLVRQASLEESDQSVDVPICDLPRFYPLDPPWPALFRHPDIIRHLDSQVRFKSLEEQVYE